MKPGQTILVTRVDDSNRYSVVMGNLYCLQLGADEALACVAQALFGDMGASKPVFLEDAAEHLASEMRFAKKPDEANVVTCRKCKESGLAEAEFTSPYTGLCGKCDQER